MDLTINNPVGGATPTALSNKHTNATSTAHISLLHHHHRFSPSCLSLSSRTPTHIVSATGKFTPRTGKFDSRNKRGASTTTTKEESGERKGQKNLKNFENNEALIDERVADSGVDDGYFLPQLPGDKQDFWEGPQWDALGFFVQYMWAFGILFALVACGIAVATYNEGATDFRETPAYKESVQSRDLLEEPEASDSDVFESNPTEEAPALE